MKVLAIDTSNKAMAVALAEDGHLLAVNKLNIKRNHSIQLMPTVESMIKTVSWQAKDIDRIAVSKGPGSYTGVRIAVTTAKSMAWALNCDLVAFSSLEAIALNVLPTSQTYICPVFNARRENIYTGLYRYEEDGKLVNVMADQHVPSQEWAEKLKDLDKDIRFVGEDNALFETTFQAALGHKFHYDPLADHLPKVEKMAMLAHSKEPVDVHHFKPDYLKLTEAEENWLKENPKQKRGNYVEKIDTMD